MISKNERPNPNDFVQARIANKRNYYIHPSYTLEQRLLSAVSSGDYELAAETLQSINTVERATLAIDSLRSVKNSLICLCTLLTRSIIKGGVNPEIAYERSDYYIIQIERTTSTEQLIELEKVMLTGFIDTMNAEREQTYSKTVNKAIHYIHDHLLTDLTLEQIANHVYVHPTHLSKLFKKEVKMPVMIYVNYRRIEESKLFLQHSTSSLSEIAAVFKFCNQSYYTATFKKFNGITPGMFRREYEEI